MTGCLEGKDELPFMLHPTGLSLPGFALPVAAGCCVGNLLLVSGVFLLHFLATVAWGMYRPRWSRFECQGMLKFPGAPMVAAVLLTTGSTLAGARLMRGARGAQDVALGIGSIGLGLGVVYVAYVRGKDSQDHSVFKLDRKTMQSRCNSFWLGNGEWLSLPIVRQQVERWGTIFRSALPGESGVIAFDFFLGQLASLGAGLVQGSCGACGAQRLVDACFAAAFFSFLLYKPRFARPIRLHATLAAQ
eukprot:Hpha_TRINITY_DN16193_c1_g7::TRINITY_DN16193_c1_g7_i4::g.3707::m.3707